MIDLDEAEPEVPLCAPLRRARSDENFYGPLYERATYRPPWFLADLEQWGGPSIRVLRCGRAKPVIAGRCVSRFCDVQLGRRHLVWLDDTVVRVYDLVTRRRVVIRTAKRVREPGSLHVTRRRVYVVPYSGGDVQAAPLPRRRPT